MTAVRKPASIAEIRDTLKEAATTEQPIHFGHDIARVLYMALLELEERQPAETEAPAHEHAWAVFAHEWIDGKAHVLQSCACGDVREVKP